MNDGQSVAGTSPAEESCEQGRLPIGRRIPSCPTMKSSVRAELSEFHRIQSTSMRSLANSSVIGHREICRGFLRNLTRRGPLRASLQGHDEANIGHRFRTV